MPSASSCTLRPEPVDHAEYRASLFGLGEHDLGRIRRRAEDPADLRHRLYRVQHVDWIEPVTEDDDEAVTRAERERVAARELLEPGVGAGPADQAFPRRFAEGQAEPDTGHGGDQSLMDVLDRLDEVRLAEDEVRSLRLVDLYGNELHIDHLRARQTWRD